MTLVEIMVVVAIIGMLMGSVGVWAFAQFKRAQVSDTKTIIKSVEQAIVHFQLANNGACPKSLQELYEQKFVTKQPVDAWGRPLQLTCPGQHQPDGADVVSAGEDRQDGTPDDIKSWEL